MKTKIIIISIFVLSALPGKAQFVHHEFSLYGAGGISEMQYDTKIGDRKTGFGGNAGIGYTFFFTPNWGIGTGAEISFMNTKYDLSPFTGSTPANDGEEEFEFRYTIDRYSEKQKTLNINIPLMLKYQTGGKTKFYAAVGGKVGFPVESSYKIKSASIKTSGYYPQYGNELFTPAFMGFGEFQTPEKKEDLPLKTMIMLSAESGVKWKLAKSLSLYTGAYIDYGLNNISDSRQNEKIVTYNSQSPAEFKYHSILDSHYNESGRTQNFTGKVIPFSVGIKVALAFGKSPKSRTLPAGPVAPQSGIQNSEAQNPQPPKENPEDAARQQAEQARRQAEQAEKAEKIRKAEEKRQYEEAVEVVKEKITGYRIGQTELPEAKKAELDEKVTLLKKYPEMKIVCTGHTCDIGSDEVNYRIGLNRAETAKAYLVGKGISSGRIEVQSKGSSQPLVPNTNEENRKINRRVEFMIY